MGNFFGEPEKKEERAESREGWMRSPNKWNFGQEAAAAAPGEYGGIVIKSARVRAAHKGEVQEETPTAKRESSDVEVGEARLKRRALEVALSAAHGKSKLFGGVLLYTWVILSIERSEFNFHDIRRLIVPEA